MCNIIKIRAVKKTFRNSCTIEPRTKMCIVDKKKSYCRHLSKDSKMKNIFVKNNKIRYDA